MLPILSEFISNNIDTSRVATKQYRKIILFYKLSNQTDIFRELLPNSADFFFRRCIRQYFFLSQMWTYSKYLLIGLSAKSTFRKVFDLKKLKIIYCWDTYYIFSWLQASAFLKQALPTRNELQWKRILNGPFNIMLGTVLFSGIT